MVSFTPAKTGNTRVFVVEGRARPDHKPAYQSAMKAGGFSQGFGDIERIEVPSASEFGKFDEIGSIRGAVERVSITLTGRYAADLKSEILRMARGGCSVDVHVNLGACTDPSDYNTFTKKVVLEDAFLTSYEVEDLGALGSDEQAKIDESVDISSKSVYEVVPISWAERAGGIVTNTVVDTAICDTPSCGDCEDESDGCKKFFALTTAAGGSPGTPADVVYSLDSGTTWYAHDVDSLLTGEVPDELDCVGSYLVVVSEDSASCHYALLSEFIATGDPAWTEVATGIVATGEPRAIDGIGSMAFVVGAGGYIYKMTDPTAGVTVLDAGVAHAAAYNAVSVLSDTFAVAVGADGIIAKTENGSTWAAVATTPVGHGIGLNTVAVKSENEWFIGTDTGLMYYTLDKGVTWTLKSFTGSGAGVIEHIEIANDSVMYLSHTTATPLGRILRSTNGGYDWVVMPEGSGSLTANDAIYAVAACGENPDIVFGGGLADDAADGFIIVGTD